jgi:ABC-type Fe3+/spermidine/putrescine transport system ATPase subunit
MPEVRLQGLGKTFGKVVAVGGVELVIKDKEYVTILGPSGCGKTTLIRMIAGIIEPSQGKVFLRGSDMKGVPIEDRGIGYVFQNIALFPNLNAAQNVAYSSRVKGALKEQQEVVAKEHLQLVKLLDRMLMFPDEMSGGEQQKVALARALASGSDLLLLDEPLSALDARVRVDLRYDLRRLTKALGLTVVHVTHDQEEAMTVSDRIVLMRAGSVVETGTPEELYSHPQHLFTANFIGESNFLEGWVREKEDGLSRVEIREGSTVEVMSAGLSIGDPVVISVRPEFVYPFTSGLRSNVTSSIYMGTYWRIKATTESDDEMNFDVPITDGHLYQIGQEIYLMVNKRAAVLFPRPREGVEEAISLE